MTETTGPQRVTDQMTFACFPLQVHSQCGGVVRRGPPQPEHPQQRPEHPCECWCHQRPEAASAESATP